MEKLITGLGEWKVPAGLCTFNKITGQAEDCLERCSDTPECKAGNCDDCPVQACFNRLAEYEDTGISPEQIREMDKAYRKKCEEVRELKENRPEGNILKYIKKMVRQQEDRK